MSRPFAVAGFTAFFTVAILSESETGVMMYAFCAYIIALVVALLIKEFRKGQVIPFFMASGAFACALLICFNLFIYEPVVAYDGKCAVISARLTSFPEERYGNTYYQAETVTVDGVETKLKLRLTFSRKPDVQPYDIVNGEFTFYRPGYTSDDYLQSNVAKGNYLGAYSVGDVSVVTVEEKDKPFVYKLERFREEIKESVFRIMPDKNGALLNALLIGDKSGIDDKTLVDFNNSGITHIICVSGFHLSLWAGFILSLLKKLGFNIKISSLVAMVGVLAFMLIAGMGPSVLRSGIMMLVYLAANVFSRKSDSLNSLGFSLLVIAVYNPMMLTGLSLRLSALSTLGIILYNNYLSEKVQSIFDKIKNKYLAFALGKIAGSLAVTASALAFIQPITLQMQGSFNFAVLFSNLLVTFAAAVCMVAGALAAVSGFVLPPEMNFFAFIPKTLSRYILFLADKFSDWQFLTFYVDKNDAKIIIAVILMICSAALYRSFWRKINPFVPIALCSVIFMVSVIASSIKIYNQPRFDVLDVGNATAVGFAYKGKKVLFGCGGTLFDSEGTIRNYAQTYGGKLDALIIPDNTEQNAAHALNLIKNFNPETIRSNGLSTEVELIASSEITLALDEPIAFKDVNISNIKTGDNYATFIETPDVTALICYHPVLDISLIPEEYQHPDIFITRSDYPPGIENNGIDFIAVNAQNSRGVLIQNELLSRGVNCAATADCGNLTIVASGGELSFRRN